MAKQENIEEKRDDSVLFEVATYLLRATGQSQDPRVAEICEHALELCKKDAQIVAKLFLELDKFQQQAQNATPYNAFATQPQPVSRGRR